MGPWGVAPAGGAAVGKAAAFTGSAELSPKPTRGSGDDGSLVDARSRARLIHTTKLGYTVHTYDSHTRQGRLAGSDPKPLKSHTATDRESPRFRVGAPFFARSAAAAAAAARAPPLPGSSARIRDDAIGSTRVWGAVPPHRGRKSRNVRLRHTLEKLPCRTTTAGVA